LPPASSTGAVDPELAPLLLAVVVPPEGVATGVVPPGPGLFDVSNTPGGTGVDDPPAPWSSLPPPRVLVPPLLQATPASDSAADNARTVSIM
jgi:hypothetical protein